MKRNLVFVFSLFVVSLCVSANNRHLESVFHIAKDSLIDKRMDSIATQQHTSSALLDSEGNVVDTSKVKLPNTYAWKISPRMGTRTLVPMDTVRENFHRSTLVEGQGLAMGYLGNIGGPVQSKIFFDREDPSQFIFMDPYRSWRRGPEDQYFLNTKMPYTNVFYQSGGGKESAENRFTGEMFSNFGKRLNVGFNFDYIYARGFYKSQYNKQTSYDFNASYIGDRYSMHTFMGNNNLKSSNNGGIVDDLYITHPNAEGLENFRGNSLDIPVLFQESRNKLRGRHIYVNNKYDIGSFKEIYQVNDSTTGWRNKKDYVAPASVILTTHYTDQRRNISFGDRDQGRVNLVYSPNILDDRNQQSGSTPKYAPAYDTNLDDYMSYYSLKNTLGLSMNEGFQKWMKFGLTGFIEADIRRFKISQVKRTAYDVKSDDALLIGGILSKDKGKYLRYNAKFEKDLMSSDMSLSGDITANVNILGKSIHLKAKAYLKNISPRFFQENFVSRNWIFNENFKDTRRVFVGGELSLPKLPFSETKLSGGVENIENYIYYYGDNRSLSEELNTEQNNISVAPYVGDSRKPKQYTGNLQVLALRIDQKFNAGIFHWDIEAAYQKVRKGETVLPLPDLSVYTNIYLLTKVSKVLTFQLGADATYHSEYYAPGYDPLMSQFFNQREVKIGGFPQANVYVNLHLKYTRFFIMMYNVTEGMGNKGYFSLAHYPVNPRMLKMGLSWKFNN